MKLTHRKPTLAQHLVEQLQQLTNQVKEKNLMPFDKARTLAAKPLIPLILSNRKALFAHSLLSYSVFHLHTLDNKEPSTAELDWLF